MNTRRVGLHAVTGAMAFTATQLLLFVRAGDAPVTTDGGSGWFLNTGASLVGVVGVIAAVSALIAVATPRSYVWQGTGAFAVGAIGAMALSLFAIGPGSIFPIVIAIGGAFILTAACCGGLVGFGVRWLLERRPNPRHP